MATEPKTFTAQNNTGFGESSAQGGGRFFRKDGSANVERKGIRFFDRMSWYHTMISLPRFKFYLWLLFPYIAINCVFGLVYFLVGVDHLSGIQRGTPWTEYVEAFFFSAQTFTTVGYGHVSPSGTLTSAIASFEAFLGVLTFALASGLFYGRFSRPRSYLQFSQVALIAPYKDGTALMFRTVPYKNNHLVDAEIKVTLGIREARDGAEKNRFYPLELEISKINSLVLNWTLVHPLNDESPLHGKSIEDLRGARAEIIAYIKAYDEGFSNTVIARTSYTADEIIEGAKFIPMYTPSSSGEATVLHIDRLNSYEKIRPSVKPKPGKSG